MKSVVSMELKLEAFGAFLWSLDCYRNRCYFQSTNVEKPKSSPQSLHREHLHSKRKRGSNFGNQEFNLGKDDPWKKVMT